MSLPLSAVIAISFGIPLVVIPTAILVYWQRWKTEYRAEIAKRRAQEPKAPARKSMRFFGMEHDRAELFSTSKSDAMEVFNRRSELMSSGTVRRPTKPAKNQPAPKPINDRSLSEAGPSSISIPIPELQDTKPGPSRAEADSQPIFEAAQPHPELGVQSPKSRKPAKLTHELEAPVPAELDIQSEIQPPSSTHTFASKTDTYTKVESASDLNAKPTSLQGLHARVARIRAERELLQRVSALDAMEAALLAEIADREGLGSVGRY